MAMRTKSGMVPGNDKDIPFDINTSDAEKFLQRKVDQIVEMMKKNGKEQLPVDVKLVTTRCSKKFMPFVLVLSTTALKSNGGKKKNHRELDMFNPESSDSIAKLKDEFYQLVGAYMYNKNDEHAFFSNEWRRGMQVTLKTAHFLKANRTPKIQSWNKGRDEYIMCILDPARLFHDMLVDLDHRDEKFRINNLSAEKIEGGNYHYSMTRSIVKGNKKKDKSFETRLLADINRRFNG